MKTITIDGEPYELHTYCPLRDTEDLCAILKKVENPVSPYQQWKESRGVDGYNPDMAVNWIADEIGTFIAKDIQVREPSHTFTSGMHYVENALKRLIGRKD